MPSFVRVALCSLLFQAGACIGGGGGSGGDGDGSGGDGDDGDTIIVIGNGNSGDGDSGDGDGDSGDGDGDGDSGDGDGDSGDGDSSTACASDADCDDGIDCSVDQCLDGLCVHEADHVLCDDTLYCNGEEVCDLQEGCRAGDAPNVDDGIPCTIDSCDEGGDVAVNTPNHGACDNGLYCDGAEICDPASGCQDGPAPNVDDGVDCTIDSCDEVDDVAVNTPNHGACDNGLYCDGAEICHAQNDCQPGTPPNLDDGDPCTIDSCNEAADTIVHDPGGCVGRPCSEVAQEWCEAKGWTRVDTPLTPEEAGNIVCTIDGRSYGNDCDMCDTYNIVTWRANSIIQGCNDQSSMLPGNFYSAHTPCTCGDNVDLCGQWDMQGCVPDGQRVTRNVLVAGADSDSGAAMQTELINFGAFDNVDVFDPRDATPDLQTLLMYDAVLTFTNYTYADPVAMGDVLADYVDRGGRVVVAMFAYGQNYQIQGRFETEYALLTAANYNTDGQSLGSVAEPNSPLMSGVNSFSASSAYRTTGAVKNGATVVAYWADGIPLIVRGTPKGRARADINMFAKPNLFSGDGVQIFVNALSY